MDLKDALYLSLGLGSAFYLENNFYVNLSLVWHGEVLLVVRLLRDLVQFLLAQFVLVSPLALLELLQLCECLPAEVLLLVKLVLFVVEVLRAELLLTSCLVR